MPALAEKTKINSEKGFETRTSIGWTILDPFAGDDNINPDFYVGDVSSIRVQTVPYLSSPSEHAQTILKKILKYKKLIKGWDGEDAIPPKEKIINEAYIFALNADEFDLPFYFTAPGPNGEIVIEFKSGDKTAEVYFNEDYKSEMMLYNGKEQTYADKINMELLTQHLL